ncbi:MAG: AAA family ATPase [Candidatus Pacebacteria bacterium]|nr:AAA family ATPase [Candidatus Paceibacterota bacterium]
MKNLFITVDGVDGVGKTTVSKLLAKKLNGIYYKSPSNQFLQTRQKVENPINVFGRYCFYRLATQNDSENIKILLESNHVVCDRYIASTFAYHFVMDNDITIIHNETNLLKPDLALLLTANSDTRNSRIINRNESKNWIEENSSLLDNIQNVFLSLELTEFKTDSLKPDEIVNNIIQFIQKYQLDGNVEIRKNFDDS